MKHIIILLLVGLFAQTNLMAQKPVTKFIQITTIESVVNAGLGRSKMIISKDDGSTEEKDMNNLFSIAGINFKNVKENEVSILQTLKSYTDNGWRIFSNTPLTLSPGTNGSGIFMTRYLLVKEEESK
ncbi:MAG: hypothetical protein ABIN89_07045 [Chitinophagaceae bacterium]